jgi:hypothetical protein
MDQEPTPQNVRLQNLTPLSPLRDATGPVIVEQELALTACMRNLLTILNAMLKSGTPWRVAVSQSA